MTQLTFVLNDQKPITLTVEPEDVSRLTEHLDSAAKTQTELKKLQLDIQFNTEALGFVTHEQYADAVIKLIELERMNCGGSRFAAQVLLGLYNSNAWHVDLVGVACSLDSVYRHAAITAILGRGHLRTEPHALLKNGDEIFTEMCADWKDSLHVSTRYAGHYNS
jgi:hypothetical protein